MPKTVQPFLNRTTVLTVSVVVLALSGVLSVGYITVQLSAIADKVFFVSVITAFLAPTVTALLAILRTEALNKTLNNHFAYRPRPRRRKRTSR